uniref:Uncharacterized protein n=1 Tax=Setaria italica TaxID=4555 RepID=K3YMI6_SETIT
MHKKLYYCLDVHMFQYVVFTIRFQSVCVQVGHKQSDYEADDIGYREDREQRFINQLVFLGHVAAQSIAKFPVS